MAKATEQSAPVKGITFQTPQEALQWAQQVMADPSYRNFSSVVSLWDTPFFFQRTYGCFHLEGRKPNGATVLDERYIESYSVLHVYAATSRADIGDKRSYVLEIQPHEIVTDIIENEDVKKFGLFAVHGNFNLPQRDQLEKARQVLIKLYRSLIHDGDAKWGKPETRNLISDLHRKAVYELGEKRDWVYRVSEQALKTCRWCGELQKSSEALICWNCKLGLDEQSARAHGLPWPAALPETKPEMAQAEKAPKRE